MRFTTKELKKRAEGRPSDYENIIMSLSKKINEDSYEITEENLKELFKTRPDLFVIQTKKIDEIPYVFLTSERIQELCKNVPNGYRESLYANLEKVEENLFKIKEYLLLELTGRYQMPNRVEIVRNLYHAAKDVITNGVQIRSQSEIDEILKLCATCPFLVENGFRCGVCGCYLKAKAKLETWHCPKGRW